jgi:hypothetical protein
MLQLILVLITTQLGIKKQMIALEIIYVQFNLQKYTPIKLMDHGHNTIKHGEGMTIKNRNKVVLHIMIVALCGTILAVKSNALEQA